MSRPTFSRADRSYAIRPTAGYPNICRRRPRTRFFAWSAVLAVAACAFEGDDAPPRQVATASGGAQAQVAVRPGIEVLLADSLHLVAGVRVGLITNQTGIDAEGRSDIDLLVQHPGVNLVALFAPEHGIRGTEEAGVTVASEIDGPTGLPIHSLYGQTLSPTREMLDGIDVLLFDMQDIGARYYTYLSTMALAMEASGRADIPFVVLDRPNPIRGDVVQGNVLEPDFESFVGMYPVPMRHGMTAGELARLYVGEFGVDVDLRVVPLQGWSRSLTFADTGLPWVAPSPNMPSPESALAYPGTCLFEGTALSVGRGTDRAFQWIGAPWLDGEGLAAALNGYEFDGVRFEATTFTPVAPGDGRFAEQPVSGVRLIAESTAYDAPRVAVAMLVEAYRASGSNWSWQAAHFDRLAGTDALRLGIQAGATVEDLTADWARQGAAFDQLRRPFLLY